MKAILVSLVLVGCGGASDATLFGQGFAGEPIEAPDAAPQKSTGGTTFAREAPDAGKAPAVGGARQTLPEAGASGGAGGSGGMLASGGTTSTGGTLAATGGTTASTGGAPASGGTTSVHQLPGGCSVPASIVRYGSVCGDGRVALGMVIAQCTSLPPSCIAVDWKIAPIAVLPPNVIVCCP